MTSEKEVVVDALPYFDQGYDDPGVREAVCYILQIKFISLSILELGVSENNVSSIIAQQNYDFFSSIS